MTPYAIERPGPHQPTGPTRAPWNGTPPARPPVPLPAWRSAPPGPLAPWPPRTFAADAYAEAFLNGRPHPRPVPAPMRHTPPPQAPPAPQWQPPPHGPFPNPPVPFPIPAPSYAVRPPPQPPRHP
jgi:hypothetical protein